MKSLFTAPRADMALRPYQTRVVSAVENALQGSEFNRVLMVVPTGGGKTIMFAKIAQHTLPGRTLILAHRDELIRQAVDKIAQATGIEAEVEKAEERASLNAKIVVGSVQTFTRSSRLERWPSDHFKLVVVDEAHHALSDSYQKVLEHFSGKVLGVTATPDRGDKKNLGQYFETIPDGAQVTLLELIRDKFLSPIVIKTVPIKIDLRGVKVVQGDYDAGDLGARLEQYLERIADSFVEHASFRKILVFLPLIDTSKHFVEILKAKGLAAEHVDGMSPDRAQILERFAKGKFDVLCNAMLLTEGYDCPDIDCVVCLRPTKVRSLFAQIVGRGTRIAKGKQNLLLLDYLWMHEKHNLVKPAHLIASTDRVADAMSKISEQQELDLEELQRRAIDLIEEEMRATEEAKEQREASLKKALKDNSKRNKKTIDAMEFFTSVHDIENAEYEPQFGWQTREASAAQLSTLERFGIDTESVKCRGHAAALLDRLISRSQLGLATAKQMMWLKKLGHPSPDTATFDEAKTFLDSKFNKPKPTFEPVAPAEEVPF